MAKTQAIKQALTYASWPMVFFSGLAGSYFAFTSNHPITGFLVVYACAVMALFLLERYIPYEVEWLEGDGETATSIGHTLLTKGLVQLAAVAGAIFPMVTANVLQPLAAMRFDMWPSDLPMVVQVALAV
ncbi:MAG TPA: sterol desaturase, partial [Agrobacterium sp.]|nr:sterol desaturase [Agrobacterium sp.]